MPFNPREWVVALCKRQSRHMHEIPNKFFVWGLEVYLMKFETMMIIYEGKIIFYKPKFVIKLVNLSTQEKHIDMGTCAKKIRMSASEFKVKMSVNGWIYRSYLLFFLNYPIDPFALNRNLDGRQPLKRRRIGDQIVSLKANNKILVILYEKIEINET